MKNMYFLDVTFSDEDKLKILTSVGIVPIETYFFFKKVTLIKCHSDLKVG